MIGRELEALFLLISIFSWKSNRFYNASDNSQDNFKNTENS